MTDEPTDLMTDDGAASYLMRRLVRQTVAEKHSVPLSMIQIDAVRANPGAWYSAGRIMVIEYRINGGDLMQHHIEPRLVVR